MKLLRSALPEFGLVEKKYFKEVLLPTFSYQNTIRVGARKMTQQLSALFALMENPS